MTNKKIARLAACRLKGHTVNPEGRCRDCYMEFWAQLPMAWSKEAKLGLYDKKMEALDC